MKGREERGRGVRGEIDYTYEVAKLAEVNEGGKGRVEFEYKQEATTLVGERAGWRGETMSRKRQITLRR